MEWEIGNYNRLMLVGVAVASLLLAGYGQWQRRRSARRFADVSQLPRLGFHRRSLRQWLPPWLSAVSLALLALALADVRYGRAWQEVPQRGIEVMFLLDISRSMLAEDATPNRLDRAKQQIRDLTDEMAGDRFGLVVFAGEAKQVVPLTNHAEDFQQILASVGPHSVRYGGSKLGEAIRLAQRGFMDKTADHKAIVIFTDGEDQESDPITAAKNAYEEKGVHIFTIGLGDMDQGARIPVGNRQGQPSRTFLQYDGQTVWSKMNGATLRQIAEVTDGAYIPAGTKSVNMKDVYQGYISNIEQTEFESARINAFVPRFQWFAIPALGFLVLEILVTTGWRLPHFKTLVGIVFVFTATMTNRGWAQSPFPNAKPATNQWQNPLDRMNYANELVRQGKLDEALQNYAETEADTDELPLLHFNQGVALYRNHEYSKALQHFQTAASTSDLRLASQSHYNMGNSRYALALASRDEQHFDDAVELLGQAIDDYRRALRTNPQFEDARANIELAVKLINQLRRQQEQANQSPGSAAEEQGKQDPQQDAPQEQQEGSQQESEPSDSSSPSSPGQDVSPQEDEDENASENDGDSSESAKSNSGDEQESMDQPSQPSAAGSQQSGSDTDQQQSQTDQSSQQQSAGQNNQQPGADETEEANPQENNQSTESGNPNDENNFQQGSSSAGSSHPDQDGDTENATVGGAGNQDQQTPPASDGKLESLAQTAEGQSSDTAGAGARVVGTMTREEAMKMLQAVRDRDMLRRLLQQQREQRSQLPVQRDW